MKQFTDADGRERTRLETWGEIAHHQGVEVRTAQRWERNLGMPVHRLKGSQAVFAYVDELDTWRASRTAGAPPASEAAPPPEPDATAAPAGDVPAASPRRRPGWSIAAAVAAIAIAGAWVANAPSPQRAVPPPSLSAVGLEGNWLVAAAANGDRVWAYDFGKSTTMLHGLQDRPQMSEWWQRVDIDGDGVDELVVVVTHPRPGESMPWDTIYGFSLDGSLRFQWQPDVTASFRERSYRAPWRVMDIEPVPADKRLWVALANVPWWPGVVVGLDVEGRPTTRFVQPGVIQVLKTLATDRGQVVLASGVNNEYASASAAFLDATAPPASAPHGPDGPFTCLDCPAGAPRKYLLFAPSAHNRAAGFPYNRADGAEVSGPLRISTWESQNGPGILYELSPALDVVSATPGDGYWTGGITATDDSWVARDPRVARIQSWTPAAGWTRQDLPYTESASSRVEGFAPRRP